MNDAQRAERERIIARYSSGPPPIVVLFSVLLVLKAVVPFVLSLVTWSEAGCGTSCTGWASLVTLFVGIAGGGLLVSLLCVVGVWSGNVVGWGLALVFHLLIGVVVPAVFGGTGAGAGTIAIYLVAFNLPFIALLFAPSIRRWCWPARSRT